MSRSRSRSQDLIDVEEEPLNDSDRHKSKRSSRSRSREFKDLEDGTSGSRHSSKRMSRSRSRSGDFKDLEGKSSGTGDRRKRMSRSRSRSGDFKDLEDAKEEAKNGRKSSKTNEAAVTIAGATVASNGKDVEATAEGPEQAPLLGGVEVKKLTKVGKSFRDDIKQEPLEENIFSLIFVAKTYSLAFVMSVTVAIMQILMLFLALMDLVDVNDSGNPMRVPNDVSLPVRATGVVCLLLSIAQFWDFMQSIEVRLTILM